MNLAKQRLKDNFQQKWTAELSKQPGLYFIVRLAPILISKHIQMLLIFQNIE